MKTRDDYLESIFEKRENYIAEQRKKRKTALSFCIPLTACLAVGSVIIFGSSRAETAKSLDYAAGSSLNGDAYMEDCQSPDESGQYMYAENDGAYKGEDKYLYEGCSPAVDAESAKDDSGTGGEGVSTTVSSEATARNSTSADKGTNDGTGNDGLQMTIAGYTKTTAERTTAVTATTTPEEAVDTDTFVKFVSISVSSGTAWVYSSEKDYSSYDTAFLWAIDGGLDKLSNSNKTAGEIYTIKLILSDGTTRIFEWSGNSMREENGSWKTISDSQKRAIELAVNND